MDNYWIYFYFLGILNVIIFTRELEFLVLVLQDLELEVQIWNSLAFEYSYSLHCMFLSIMLFH